MGCQLTNCVIFYRTCSTPGSQPLPITAVQPGKIGMMTAARAIATTTGDETGIGIEIGIVIGTGIVTTTAGTGIIAEMQIVTGMATAIATTATAIMAAIATMGATTAATVMVDMAGEITAEAIRGAFRRRIRTVSIATTHAGASIARPIIWVKR